jgi:uncharacterized protein
MAKKSGFDRDTRFIGRNPVAIFFILASVLSLGELLFVSGFPIVDETVQKMGLPLRSTLLFGLQLYLENQDTWFGILGLVYHPFTPTIAALVVLGYLGGWNAIRELLSRLRPWQRDISRSDGLKVWLIAITTMMALNACSALIASKIFGSSQYQWTPGQFGWLPVWAWLLAGLFTDAGGVGEELGWRGFGSSFLQSKYAPLKAAIFLGLLWSFWHFPSRIPGLLDDPWFWLKDQTMFTVLTVSTTVTIAYFSNKVGGSAFMAIMIHSQMNDSFGMRGMLAGDNPSQSSQLLLYSMYMVPQFIAAIFITYITKGNLGFNRSNPNRQIWSWPKSDIDKMNSADEKLKDTQTVI